MAAHNVEITRAEGPRDLAIAHSLILDYRDWLKADQCFDGLDAELADLAGHYAPPGGLWLARVDGAIAGCVGLRALDDERAEMKRLWLDAGFRGMGLGRQLVETCIAAAREAGFRLIVLDTLDGLAAASSLYKSVGFKDIAPIGDKPRRGTRYQALDLQANGAPDTEMAK